MRDAAARSAFRRAVEADDPARIIAAAHAYQEISVEEAIPVLLALATDSETFERAARRWALRFAAETKPPPDGHEVRLAQAALYALPRFDSTSLIGAEALCQLFEERGLDFALAALERWMETLG